jgi:hypothetical protein
MKDDSQEMKELIAFALTVPQEERNRVAKEAVERMESELTKANAEVHALISKVSEMPVTNGMLPSIFMAIKLDGKYHVGINYQPQGTVVGHQFHYDHGVGIERNTHAMVHWIKAA